MKCVHAMPFGAEIRADGSVRFRLYAPAAARVDLVLESARKGARETLAMAKVDGRFFERVTSSAGSGSRYRYRIDERIEVPDPASRSNPDDPNGPSEVVDPAAYEWNDGAWRGRPWHEAVIYELHVGAFTPEGSFA
ncbi:MAG TPA: malto-oligosyltrehalose trehalohydrolase, partial [Casimicrobiaceae bacterium]|nr:malto-oligosyltrehalose trehalohydrolase [Casimicrobiaceae bacterium]